MLWSMMDPGGGLSNSEFWNEGIVHTGRYLIRVYYVVYCTPNEIEGNENEKSSNISINILLIFKGTIIMITK